MIVACTPCRPPPRAGPHLQVWHLSSSGCHCPGAFRPQGKLGDIPVAGKGPLATRSEGLAAAIHAGIVDLDNHLHSNEAEPEAACNMLLKLKAPARRWC